MRTVINPLLFFIIFIFSINIYSQENNVKSDTVYIFKNSNSDKTYISYYKFNNDQVLTSIHYKIRPLSFWKSLEESKKKGNLIGDIYHASFSLNYVINSCDEKIDNYPSDNKIISKKELLDNSIIDWNDNNSIARQEKIINMLKNAKVIYAVNKENSYKYFLQKVKFKN
jgi:hypothetical protein